jgi:hypothetical protein
MSQIPQEYAKHFEYRDGNLYWRHDRGSQKCEGKMAGTPAPKGYLRVRVRELGGAILAHRIIFAMHHGYLPEFVDHIDGNPANNRIENLREATKAENCRNSKTPTHNTSGVKNVSWYKANKKWSVHLMVQKRKRFFGLYDDLELAELVAHEARSKFYGAFANHGVHLCLK